MPAGFTETLAERLNNVSGLSIKEAQAGDQLKPGHGLLAPGDFHMEIDAQGKVSLNKKIDYMEFDLVLII